MKDIQNFDLNKLVDVISQLTEEVDKLRNLKGEPEESRNVAEMPATDAEAGKTGLERRVESLLGLYPPDISAAYTAIRRAIEEYCMFVKGFDLNDVFLPKDTRRTEKFRAAGIEPNRVETLDKIFLAGNKGTHGNNIEFMSSEEIQEHKQLIRQYVQQLNAWGMADVDKVNGRFRFCCSQDRLLQQKLDSVDFDTNSEQFQNTLYLYFKRLNEFINDYHVDVNTVDIRFKNEQDVYDYLLGKSLKKGVGALSANDKARVFSVYKKQAADGDFEACLWMCDYYRTERNPQKVVEYYILAMSADGAAEKINQLSNDIRMRAGYALYEAKEYTAALKWIDNIGNDIDATILSGDCYYCENNVQAAITQYKFIDAASLKGDKRKMLVADSLCETAPNVALKYYTLCSNADSDPEVLKRIGDCYLKLDYTENALYAYEGVLSVSSPYTLKQQVVEIIAKRFSSVQVRSAFKKNGERVVANFANHFWNYGMKTLAVKWYEECNSSYISAYTQKEIANFYLQEGKIIKAVDWYENYVCSTRDYSRVLSLAKQIWVQGNCSQAVRLYVIYASKYNDATISKFLAEYYQTNNCLRDAIRWYEKCYSISESKDENILNSLIRLNEQVQSKQDVLKWKKELAGLLFEKGEIEEAIGLYEEYSKVYVDKNIALILAEYYYYHDRYQEAEEMLSAYTKTKVMIHQGFAVSVDGPLFIAYNQRLVPVEWRMVKKLKIKHVFLSNKKGATLYLERFAGKGLPSEIVLFEKLHKKSLIVQTLKEQFSKKQEQDKKERKERKRQQKEKKKETKKVLKTNRRKTFKKWFDLGTWMLLTAILFIFIAILVGSEEAGGFWKWTAFLSVSFAVLYGMYQAGGYDDEKLLGSICWITMAMEYLIKAVTDYRHDIVSKGCTFVVKGKPDDVDASVDFLGSIILEPIPAIILIIIIAVVLKAYDPAKIFRGIKLFKFQRVKMRKKENPLINLAIFAFGLLGIFGTIYNIEEGYSFSDGMYYVQVVLVGVLAFAASAGIASIKREGISLLGSIFMWGSLVVQYAIHLCFQAYLWLDPNDGPLSIGEFFVEGILLVIISAIACLVIYIFAQRFQKQ